VSGYIDYAHRLKTSDLEAVFERKKRFMPKPSDLSYYNWDTQFCASNSTPNFQVIADETGLLFKCKRDRKIIRVEPKVREPVATTAFHLLTKKHIIIIIILNFLSAEASGALR
jgi:hypothetical protein